MPAEISGPQVPRPTEQGIPRPGGASLRVDNPNGLPVVQKKYRTSGDINFGFTSPASVTRDMATGSSNESRSGKRWSGLFGGKSQPEPQSPQRTVADLVEEMKRAGKGFGEHSPAEPPPPAPEGLVEEKQSPEVEEQSSVTGPVEKTEDTDPVTELMEVVVPEPEPPHELWVAPTEPIDAEFISGKPGPIPEIYDRVNDRSGTQAYDAASQVGVTDSSSPWSAKNLVVDTVKETERARIDALRESGLADGAAAWKAADDEFYGRVAPKMVDGTVTSVRSEGSRPMTADAPGLAITVTDPETGDSNSFEFRSAQFENIPQESPAVAPVVTDNPAESE